MVIGPVYHAGTSSITGTTDSPDTFLPGNSGGLARVIAMQPFRGMQAKTCLTRPVTSLLTLPVPNCAAKPTEPALQFGGADNAIG
jgi:hypothetical protein